MAMARQLTYNGIAQQLVLPGAALGGTLEYTTDNKAWSSAVPMERDAGSCTVYVVANNGVRAKVKVKVK